MEHVMKKYISKCCEKYNNIPISERTVHEILPHIPYRMFYRHRNYHRMQFLNPSILTQHSGRMPLVVVTMAGINSYKIKMSFTVISPPNKLNKTLLKILKIQ